MPEAFSSHRVLMVFSDVSTGRTKTILVMFITRITERGLYCRDVRPSLFSGFCFSTHTADSKHSDRAVPPVTPTYMVVSVITRIP